VKYKSIIGKNDYAKCSYCGREKKGNNSMVAFYILPDDKISCYDCEFDRFFKRGKFAEKKI